MDSYAINIQKLYLNDDEIIFEVGFKHHHYGVVRSIEVDPNWTSENVVRYTSCIEDFSGKKEFEVYEKRFVVTFDSHSIYVPDRSVLLIVMEEDNSEFINASKNPETLHCSQIPNKETNI